MARKKANRKSRTLWIALVAVIVIALVAIAFILSDSGSKAICTYPVCPKPIILYIDQGNGIVNGSGYGTMLGFASSQGFNTVFFQVYRQGSLLFSPQLLQSLVSQAHAANLRIFFALYFTNDSQTIPMSILGLNEDGVSLDMSTLDPGAQQSLLTTLQSHFNGMTAVTTYDFSTNLKPDLLVFETYGTQDDTYIRQGIIASVGAFTTTSYTQYEAEFQYALQNSDGVMVFDYHWLMANNY